MTVREYYRRTLIPMQLCILGICAILYFKAAMPPVGILCFFVVMQLGSVVGAWWGTRLTRKMEARRTGQLLKP